MRCIFAGTPAVAAVALQAILDSPHEVVAVITRPPARTGRGRGLAPSEVSILASEMGIPVLTPTNLHDQDFEMQLRELRPDCCPVVAYGALVPPLLLDIPVHGWVNLHFSLLPAWRGAAPVQWALLAGDAVTGATTFYLAAGLDTGPIFGTVTEPIEVGDTAGGLLERLAVSGGQLLVATLDGLATGSLEAVSVMHRNFRQVMPGLGGLIRGLVWIGGSVLPRQPPGPGRCSMVSASSSDQSVPRGLQLIGRYRLGK